MTDKKPAPDAEVGSNLRRQNKPVGSTFGSLMRTCLKCGKYRTPAQLRTIRILGRFERVCEPSCKALEASV